MRVVIVGVCVVLLLHFPAAVLAQIEDDADAEHEGIEPVADPHPFSAPAADHLDEEVRPPGALDGQNDEDLGAVESLTSAPSEEDLKRIQDNDNITDESALSRPPIPIPGLDSNNPAKQQQQQHHHHHQHHALAPKVQPHAQHRDGGKEGVPGVSGARGYDSRATVAYDAANKAIEKAKRAAEEAKLAIQAAEAAKHEADEVARRGGDGGPETNAQGLLDISGSDMGDITNTASDDSPLPAMHRASLPDDFDIEGQHSDAADLGLPDPNPPAIFTKGSQSKKQQQQQQQQQKPHSRFDSQLGAVNNAQLDERTTRRQDLVRLHSAVVKSSMLDLDQDQDQQRHHAEAARVPEGEGSEDDFSHETHHHHHHHHHDHPNHVKLTGDSEDD